MIGLVIWDGAKSMTPSLNIVGSGNWAQKLYRSCLDAGFRVDRVLNRSGQFPGWVPENSRGLFSDYVPDSTPLLVAAGPELNAQVLQDPRFHHTPLFLEKPATTDLALTLSLLERPAPTAVDYVLLFSSAFQFIQEKLQGIPLRDVCIQRVNVGSGPQRSFSALWDYGPHEASMFHHLGLGHPTDIRARSYASPLGSSYDVEISSVSGARFRTSFGNLSNQRQNFLRILSPDILIEWDCVHSTVQYNGSDVPLRVKQDGTPLVRSISAFMRMVSDPNYRDSRLGWYTTEITTRILKEVETQTRMAIP